MSAQAESPTLQATTAPTGEKRKTLGRPSSYRPAIGELICARLADGETLSQICRTPGIPTRQTVHQWRMRYQEFDDLYYRARAIGMESMSDDTLLIADDDALDTLPDGSPNPTNVNRARLQVHARHFLMGKLARHRYGERVEVEHSGTVEHAVTLSDRERMRRLATFLAEDQAAGSIIEGQAIASPALPADNETEPAALGPMDKESDDV